MVGICEGLNVVELGSGSAAASIAGVILADAGARVLKVEPPEGDRLRESNPSGFLVWNRGKESVIADLRTAAGQQQLRDLAADADIVIEGFARRERLIGGASGPKHYEPPIRPWCIAPLRASDAPGPTRNSRPTTPWSPPRPDCGPAERGAIVTGRSCSPCRGAALVPRWRR